MRGGGWGAGGRPLTWGRAPRPAPAAPRAELQVQETNYSTFALVLFQGRPGGWPDIRVNLLCEPRVPAPRPAPGGQGGGRGGRGAGWGLLSEEGARWAVLLAEAGGAPERGGGVLGQDTGRPGPPPALRAAPCSWAPGRAWEIRAEVLDRFVCLVRAKGLSKNNVVFPDLTGSRSGRGRGPRGAGLQNSPGSP